MMLPKSAAAVLLVLSCACASVPLDHTTYSVPKVTSVMPKQLKQATTPQVITVSGTNFLKGLTALVSDPAGNTQLFVGQTVQSLTPGSFQIAVTFTLSGSYSVLVHNVSGESSDPFPFVVQGSASGTTLLAR